MPGVWCSVGAGGDTVLFESWSLRDVANLVDAMGERDPSGAVVFVVSGILGCLGSVIAPHQVIPVLGAVAAGRRRVVLCGLLVMFRGLHPPDGRSDPPRHQNTSREM